MKNKQIQEKLTDAEHAILYAMSLLRQAKEQMKNSKAPPPVEEKKSPSPLSEPVFSFSPQKDGSLCCGDPKRVFYDPDAYLTHQFSQQNCSGNGDPGNESEIFIGKDDSAFSDKNEQGGFL